MLETDEVDIDYFTPGSGTSLARIFCTSQSIGTEASLKYVAPLPTPITDKLEGNTSTQFIYTNAFNVYEWYNNSHVPKGKLGFAIIKISLTGIHNMVIYNSQKITLSYVPLNSNVTLNIDREHWISYYDSNNRYWSIVTTQPELKKIIDIMEQLNVQLKYTSDLVDGTQNHNIVENLKETSVNKIREHRESDTDTSINNKKTKEIILKRMATMGHSVLPPSNIIIQTSDSSDTNDGTNQPKARHKLFKINSKRHIDKKESEDECNSDGNLRTALKPILTKERNKDMFNMNNQQIVPIKTCDDDRPTNILSESTSMNMYISEQRVTNSELRVNMNKMSDKIDIILDKVKDIETSDSYQHNSTSSLLFQNEIVSKLLGEYEKKIKKYEDFFKLKEYDNSSLETSFEYSYNKQINVKLSEESNLDIILKTKDDEISQLRNELQRISAKCEENKQIKNEMEIAIQQEISNLKQELQIKNKENKSLTLKLDNVSNNTEKDEFKNKLKEIMNDTFQTISRNFDNNETYSGTTIKNVVASVIKKTTMDALLNE